MKSPMVTVTYPNGESRQILLSTYKNIILTARGVLANDTRSDIKLLEGVSNLMMADSAMAQRE